MGRDLAIELVRLWNNYLPQPNLGRSEDQEVELSWSGSAHPAPVPNEPGLLLALEANRRIVQHAVSSHAQMRNLAFGTLDAFHAIYWEVRGDYEIKPKEHSAGNDEIFHNQTFPNRSKAHPRSDSALRCIRNGVVATNSSVNSPPAHDQITRAHRQVVESICQRLFRSNAHNARYGPAGIALRHRSPIRRTASTQTGCARFGWWLR